MLNLQQAEGWTIAWFGLFPLLLAVALPCVAMVVYVLSGPGRERKRRLQVIELALQRQDLTPAERQPLLQALAEPPRPRWAPVMVVGWLATCVGGGFLLTGPAGDEFTIGVLVTALGFGLVTLPYAFRELERRHA